MLKAGARRGNALDHRATFALRAAGPGWQTRHLRFRHVRPSPWRAYEAIAWPFLRAGALRHPFHFGSNQASVTALSQAVHCGP